VADAEGLQFAVPVQYRRKDWNSCYLSNDLMYQRFRSVNVGPGDERRVFGLDEQNYELLSYPYRINNNLPNGVAMFASLKRYRLFRRLGLELVKESGGRQLRLSNTTLIGIRARFGGQPVDGAAFSIMSDGWLN
jgi:HK97 family phage major capsid protein